MFVLISGTPHFYYSEQELNDQEIDQSLLSSGLLSAISSFSEEARASRVQSFTSEKELFVFTKLPSFEANLVGAFDNDTPLNLANVVLQKIKDEIMKADILEDSTNVDLLEPNKVKFAERIPSIMASIIDTAAQQEYFKSRINQLQGVFLSFIMRNSTEELLWKFARPQPLFNKKLLHDLQLLFKVSNNMVEKSMIGEEVMLISIRNGTNGVVSYNNGFITATVASNMASEKDLQDTATEMGYLSSIEELYANYDQPELCATYTLQDKELRYNEGKDCLAASAKIFIMTVLNNVTKFYQALFNKSPVGIQFFVRIADTSIRLLEIKNLGKNQSYSVSIYD